MRSRTRWFSMLLVALMIGCHALPAPLETSEAKLLSSWMTGSFSSAAQAAEQPDDYYDIRLFMVPIWKERTDGEWLYVEQSAASSLERPYRQRVYCLVDTPEGPRSDVYELPGDPLELAGTWRTPEVFDAIDVAQLSRRDGCSIHLARINGVFEGATRGEGCTSTLGGASYATSVVTITTDTLTSWDRGFDADGGQVWGAETGPYVFVRGGGDS